MANTNVTMRIDEELKSQLQELLSGLGMDMTTFFTLCAKQAIREQGLPFQPKMLKEMKKEIDNMREFDLIIGNKGNETQLHELYLIHDFDMVRVSEHDYKHLYGLVQGGHIASIILKIGLYYSSVYTLLDKQPTEIVMDFLLENGIVTENIAGVTNYNEEALKKYKDNNK